MDAEDLFELDGCRVIDETQAGLRVILPSGRRAWLPKSQIHDNSEVYALGTSGKLVVSSWIAEQEGLDD